jgi:hypothetical protein
MALSHSLIRRLILLAATAAAAFAAGLAAPAAPASQTSASPAVPNSAPTAQKAAPVAVLKTCGRGYTRAVIGGQVKCLRAGQFCAHRYDRQYRRYGYRCIRYDASVHRYRLTRIR